ncbi:hypothetical protein CEXT_5541 [Caerostris extrusa]|uniref:Uncharacterized protein n=1 Tax=Caerostris extrusa TaxID=172846 RepID=A0AAV4XJM1_CAEEX|nr:hypothetical protein CEXT_5541 [Caerostris extrusa]
MIKFGYFRFNKRCRTGSSRGFTGNENGTPGIILIQGDKLRLHDRSNISVQEFSESDFNLPWYFLSNKAYHSKIYHAHRSQAIKEREKESLHAPGSSRDNPSISATTVPSTDGMKPQHCLFDGAQIHPEEAPPRGCRRKDRGAEKRLLSRIKTPKPDSSGLK